MKQTLGGERAYARAARKIDRDKTKALHGVLVFLCLVLQAAVSFAQPYQSNVKFFTLKETVAKLLPDSPVLTRRDIALTGKQLRRLKKFKNWDSKTTAFVLYHAKNKDKKILRTLVLFPEDVRQGSMVMAVALSNQGRVVGAVLMETQNKAVNWVLPLLRAGYLETFVGKKSDLKLKLSKKFRGPGFSKLTQTYALLMANTIKKSAQLFQVAFNRNLN